MAFLQRGVFDAQNPISTANAKFNRKLSSTAKWPMHNAQWPRNRRLRGTSSFSPLGHWPLVLGHRVVCAMTFAVPLRTGDSPSHVISFNIPGVDEFKRISDFDENSVVSRFGRR